MKNISFSESPERSLVEKLIAPNILLGLLYVRFYFPTMLLAKHDSQNLKNIDLAFSGIEYPNLSSTSFNDWVCSFRMTLKSAGFYLDDINVDQTRDEYMSDLVESQNQPYELSISLHALEHLGINLYSNVTAVITEAVANSYDADAEKVEINIDVDNDLIVISDDGHGMTIEDMNSKYLTVAYKRRGVSNNHQVSEKKERPVMGRKGLGKLSLFSIANVIEVQSFRDGSAHGCVMNVEEIRRTMKNETRDGKYKPIPVSEEHLVVNEGTLIRLSDLKKKRLQSTLTSLPQHLSRRFSVLGSADFRVYVNGVEVTPSDRGDLKAIEFIWNIGDSEYGSGYQNIKECGQVESRFEGWDESWNVRGWLGTAALPTDLKTSAGNINGVVVIARGRLIHENILKEVSDAKHFSHYLTGQIEADFLDNGDVDVATSDRQRLIEDDPRVIALLTYITTILRRNVEPQWNVWRDKYKTKKVIQQHPALVEWLSDMGDLRSEAEKIITMIGKADIEEVDDRRELLKQGIVAFERLKLKGMVGQLDVAKDMDAVKLLKLIGSMDDLEASLYRDIAQGRLSIIRAFRNAVDDNEKEKVLQERLFKHLWLIDPAWERATGSEIVESALKKEPGFAQASLTKEEAEGRIDITYRTYAGKHIIIELKRASVGTPALVLAQQGEKYVNKLKKVLKTQNIKNPDIEVIFVVGEPLEETPEKIKSLMDYVSPGSEIKTYHQLIQGAINAYSEYLIAYDKTKSNIDQLAEKL